MRCSRNVIVRPGGYGDLLYLCSAIRVNEYYSNKHACWNIACHERYWGLFPYDAGLFVRYPIPADDIGVTTNYLSADLLFEQSRDNAMTLACLLTGSPISCLSYLIQPGERQTRSGITIQMAASSRARTPSTEWWMKLLGMFRHAGVPVTLLGSPNQYGNQHYICGAANFTSGKGCSFRESAAIVAGSDLFIGVDSILLHIAEAVKTPYIGLYGPIKWQQRSSGAGGHNFNGVLGCAGCNFHPHALESWPKGGPCNVTNRCEALEGIPVEAVFKKAMTLLAEKKETISNVTGLS
jgi:hypothetical protein